METMYCIYNPGKFVAKQEVVTNGDKSTNSLQLLHFFCTHFTQDLLKTKTELKGVNSGLVFIKW